MFVKKNFLTGFTFRGEEQEEKNQTKRVTQEISQISCWIELVAENHLGLHQQKKIKWKIIRKQKKRWRKIGNVSHILHSDVECTKN